MTISEHRRIDASIVRSGRDLPDPPHPWRTPDWRCIASPCVGQPLAGSDPKADLGTVMAQSCRLDDGTVFVRDTTGTIRVLCGPNCLRDFARQVERGLAPAVSRIETKPAPASRAWSESGPAERSPTIKCSGCAFVPRLKQVLVAGVWTPDIAALEASLVVPPWCWRRTPDGRLWCSGDCIGKAQAAARTAAAGRPSLGGEQAALAEMRGTIAAQTTTPGLPPVTRINDASYSSRPFVGARAPLPAAAPWAPPNAPAPPPATVASQAGAPEAAPKPTTKAGKGR